MIRRATALAAIFVAGATVAAQERSIDAAIDRMTPRERAAQLVFAGFSGTRMNDEIRALVAGQKIGGVAVFARNVNTPAQLRTLTAEMRALAPDLPPLIAVDQEGGVVSRIGEGVPVLPGQMALAATRSPELAQQAGRELGTHLRDLGIDLNFAPVLDLAEASSPIGVRAFARDPELTAAFGAAFIRGQRESGVASTAKHFPGLGFSATDSHEALPTIDATADQLRRLHFRPFREAIAAGVDAVMIGHVAVPAIDGETPATLSPKIIGILRDELHFDGLVVTDALEMRALDRKDGIGSLAVRSIAAGADMVMVLWHDNDREEVLDALDAACRSGALPDTRVRQSLRRILRLKQLRAVSPLRQPSPSVVDRIASGSVTLLRNDVQLVPLRSGAADLYIGPTGPIADAVRATNVLALPEVIPADKIDVWSLRATRAAHEPSMIVAVARNVAQASVIRAAHAAHPSARLVLISIGSPQLIRELPDADVYLCAYGYLASSQRAVAAVLSGKAAAQGKLPVDVPSYFAAGDGIIIDRSVPRETSIYPQSP
jgi:beta-N-acetylhexosaminidase